MSNLDERLVRAWMVAGADLGIEVIAPYTLRLGAAQLRCEAFLPHFGSENGALAVSEQTVEESQIRSSTMWISVLSENYAAYDRRLFIDTLDDWGWFGPKHQRPPWFTGKPVVLV